MNIKECCRRILRTTKLGTRLLHYIQKRRADERQIKQYVKELGAEVPFYIFGHDDYSTRINQAIKKRLGRGCKGYVVCREDSIISDNTEDPIIIVSKLAAKNDREFFKIVVPPIHSIIATIETLLDNNFSWKQLVIGEGWQAYLGGKVFDSFDAMLGYTRNDDLPGFTIIAPTENDAFDFSVVVLGNSTSDPYTSNIRSWPEELFYILKERGISSKIICGALNSYHSRQEVLKLLRDVIPMKPDFVISYSGINDTEYFQNRHVCEKHPDYMIHQERFIKYAMSRAIKDGYFRGNIYHDGIDAFTLGVENDWDLTTRWVNNQRIMHALCVEFGIEFMGFLQPCRDYGGYIISGEPEKKSFANNITENIQEIRQWYDSAREMISGIDYITDLSQMFSGRSLIFYDYCHVFEKGNRAIASIIADKIESKVKRKK